jgi:UDP-N-acetylmuramyl pentapeptide phosphotransferase/UDP-N-acetylglucosamine-1-phosphate transferase
LKVYLLALLVFAYGNVRKKALFFMGDVGSISLGLFASCLVFFAFAMDLNLAYLLLLAVYGVDSLATIIFRLLNKENITQAHRSHAYQLLSNEGKWGHLSVAFLYAALQLLINYFLSLSLSGSFISLNILILTTLISLSLLYIFIKYKYQPEALPWIK